MSGEKYIPSNDEKIHTSDSDEENPMLYEKNYIYGPLNSRIEREQNQTTEHRYSHEIPSEDLENRWKKDTADAYSSKQSKILSTWKNGQEKNSNIAEIDGKRSSENVSNYSNSFHAPSINKYPDNAPLFSCPSNANPKAIDEAKDRDGINSSTFICDDDLADAGPSYVTCDVCNQNFDDEYLLEQHKSIHTPEKPIANEISDHSLSETKLPKYPLTTRTKKKKHQCDHCPKSFSRKSNLFDHKMIHTGEKPYQCEICHKQFAQKCNLIAHLGVHTGEKPYQCEICYKKFTRKGHLFTHLWLHTGEKPYKCEYCDKTFSRKTHLVTHLRIHTGEMPYKCEKCGKSFSDQRNFRRHTRICVSLSAERQRKYKCDKCPKSSTRKGNLIDHYTSHTGENPYECEKCHKKFSTKRGLNNHYRTHTGEKPFECEKCHEKFARKDSLYSHRRTHTDCHLFKCRKCGKSFADEGKLNRHCKNCVFSPKSERNE